MALVILFAWLFGFLSWRRPSLRRVRRFVPAARVPTRARKPEWAVEETIRLKALMSEAGCRRIADTFNRIHAARHATTVSKTWVAEVVRRHRLRIAERRRQWKRRVPRPAPINLTWGLDLTGKMDMSGRTHAIAALVDHGSRLAVTLRAIPDRATVTILRLVLEAIERHGKPRAIRTDNEAIFTSRLFRWSLAVLGIRHQRTCLHCPWQNGRVERFFGTLKGNLDRWAVDDLFQLQLALGDFRDWYNHVRPHRHLGGVTPAEAWAGIDPYAVAPKEIHYFSAWDGMLTGFYLRR